jgi:hypothetical protein
MGTVNTMPKKITWKRRLWKHTLFMIYLGFAIIIPLLIINSQFDLIGVKNYTEPRTVMTGWGFIAVTIVIVFILNELNKRAKLEKNEAKKERIGSIIKALVIIGFAGIHYFSGLYYVQFQVILWGAGISELIASIIEYYHSKMVEEDNLRKQFELEARLKAQ